MKRCIYKQLIRPCLTYGIPILTNTNENALRKLGLFERPDWPVQKGRQQTLSECTHLQGDGARRDYRGARKQAQEKVREQEGMTPK